MRGPLLRPPYTLFAFGMFVLFLAVIYTYTGKAWSRFRGWVYRAEEPRRYWLEVAMYYLLGFGVVGYFLYEVSGLSH